MGTRKTPVGGSVLITGCSSGIGHCAALGLVRRGYRVFAGVRRAKDLEDLENQGLEPVLLDLDDPESIGAALDQVLNATGGKLYGLFNNGAWGQPGAVEDLRRDVLRAQFETNFLGTHDLTVRVLPVMRKQGYGRIIVNSSVLGLAALPFRGAYNASKFALEGLMDTLRLELSGTGIHVSLIEPGPIASRFRVNAYQAFLENIDAETSVHRKRYQAMEKRLTTKGAVMPGTLPPEAVLKKVIHALESGRPRPRYFVTYPTWLIAALKRVLTTRAMDRVLRKI